MGGVQGTCYGGLRVKAGEWKVTWKLRVHRDILGLGTPNTKPLNPEVQGLDFLTLLRGNGGSGFWG